MGFQLMQILGLLGMYFDDVVVQVEKYLLFFRLALAILRTCKVLFLLGSLKSTKQCNLVSVRNHELICCSCSS